MLVLFLSIFHTLPVNSQNSFLSADFVCNKCLVLIQTCSRTYYTFLWLDLHFEHFSARLGKLTVFHINFLPSYTQINSS